MTAHSTPSIYGVIGRGYSSRRAPDPRIAARIWAAFGDAQRGAEVEVVPVPWDCTDGFQAAYWRRPERYLDPQVRASISTSAVLPDHTIEPAMAKLADDLASGR